MNYHEIRETDLLNGEGIRISLFCAGCSLACPNCFNPQTWDFTSGKPFTNETIQELITALNKPYIKGLTLTGGNPLEPRNLDTIRDIEKVFRHYFDNKKDIWLYTGFTWEELCTITQWQYKSGKVGDSLPMFDALLNADVVVEGRYIDELNDVKFPYRGSTNQRLIDVKKSWSGKEQYFDTKDMVEYKI